MHTSFGSSTNADTHQIWHEDVLFMFADAADVGKMEWDYDAGKEKLTAKVEFKAEDLFGKDSGISFKDFDTALLEEAFQSLGADTLEIAKLEIKDDEIKLELRGYGVSATEELIAEALAVISTGLTLEDAAGNEASAALYLGEDPALMDELAQGDLTDLMDGYIAYLDAPATTDQAGYAPTTSDQIIENFHDFNTDRHIPDRLVMTEDVWFAKAASDYQLCKTDDALRDMEWDYSRGGDRLELQVDFMLEGLFGEAHTQSVTDVDISNVRAILEGLGATSIEISKLEIKHDRILLEVKGEGIDITDEEVYALPDMVTLGLSIDDGTGKVETADLDLCVQKFDPHSPVAFDLNEDGRISTTGVSTAKDRVDTVVGETVMFDIDGDGTADEIEWIAADGDALLVDNRDGNALTDMDGVRLFGDEGGKYVNGYQKMSVLLDDDKDGVLVASEFDGLAFWFDDGDAIAEDGELIDVQAFGVSEIGTGYYQPENERGETLMRSWAVIEGADIVVDADDFSFEDSEMGTQEYGVTEFVVFFNVRG